MVAIDDALNGSSVAFEASLLKPDESDVSILYRILAKCAVAFVETPARELGNV